MLSGVRRVSTGHMATCPAHDDKQQSLHISANGTGLGLKCHAGCSNESILAVMCLKWGDLFYEEQTRQTEEIVATYDYTDEAGRLLYQSVRYQPKGFKQRHPDGFGGWVWNMKGVQRVPYLLHEILASDDPIFIVEGEKDVHTLRVHGFLATTNAGGAGKWLSIWTPYFTMRKVIVIPDLDAPGIDHGNDIARHLRSVADVRYIRLWGAKDISEWFLTHTVEDFNALVEAAPDFETSLRLKEVDPEPMVWLPGPIDYGLFGDIVKLLEPHTEGDPLALYVELMAMFGSCVGSGPHFRVGGTYHRCNLFVSICGETSRGRKGTAHDWVVEVFRNVDPHYVDHCVIGGLASGEGVIHAVRDGKTKTGKEGAVVVLDEGVSDKRRLFFESELAGRTFTAMKREGSTLSAVLRQAWESTTMSVATKQNDDKATGAHVSVVGHATMQELLSTLRVSDIVGGFANRFLFFTVRRSKMLPIHSVPDAKTLGQLAGRLAAALQNARKISQVTLSDEAVKLWIRLYRELDSEAQDDDLAVAPFLSRGAPQILRMAMILTLADGQSAIGSDQLVAAHKLWACARQAVQYMLDKGSGILTPDQTRLFEFIEGSGSVSCSDAKESMKWSGTRFALVKAQLLRLRIICEEKERGSGGRPKQMLSVA